MTSAQGDCHIPEPSTVSHAVSHSFNYAVLSQATCYAYIAGLSKVSCLSIAQVYIYIYIYVGSFLVFCPFNKINLSW